MNARKLIILDYYKVYVDIKNEAIFLLTHIGNTNDLILIISRQS